MQPVAVRILHPASRSAAALERTLATARSTSAQRLASLFESAGAGDVRIEEGWQDGRSFGERIRGLLGELPVGGGLIVLGSGSIPLARPADAAAFVAVAGSGERRALANNRYSADVVAVGAASALASVPDLPGDNALPRWLDEVAGFEVDDVGSRWRLQVDLDSPLDVHLAGGALPGIDLSAVSARRAALRELAADRRRELVVAGRTSGRTIRWLEWRTACRVRVLVEERGLRASTPTAMGDGPGGEARPPRSVVGMLLDDRGPAALGGIVRELGDGALIDTRVLLAHRLGADESGWPVPEDRFASDLLFPDLIADPWLHDLTTSARDAGIPVLLGGHTLVGPGIRLLLGDR